MTELVKRAELLASEAKRIGFWDKEYAIKFVSEIENNLIGEEMLTQYETEINQIIHILDEK